MYLQIYYCILLWKLYVYVIELNIDLLLLSYKLNTSIEFDMMLESEDLWLNGENILCHLDC